MKTLAFIAAASLTAACATAPPPPGSQVSEAALSSAVVPGQTTRAALLAALGQTRHIVFDSGYETWLYQVPAEAGRYSEYVVLIGPDGIVRKTRRRAAEPLAPR